MPQTADDNALASAARKWRVKSPVFLALMALVFFAGSGCFRWPEAWLFILLTAAGKLVAFLALVVFTIAVPLTRIQVARESRAADLSRVTASNLAIAAFGVVGVFILLENVRIFLAVL